MGKKEQRSSPGKRLPPLRWLGVLRYARLATRRRVVAPLLGLAAGVGATWGLTTVLSSTRFVVRGDSMAPTFLEDDYLLVSRTAYLVADPSRGDVVVVRDPHDPTAEYLKRVVGLPRERVRVEGGRVFADGRPLEEPYLDPASLPEGGQVHEWELGEDEYVVLGDNRRHSSDSRRFGPVTVDAIVGKAWFRYWPRHRWGPIR